MMQFLSGLWGSVRIDLPDGEIPVNFRQVPALGLFAAQRFLVGEQFLFDGAGAGSRRWSFVIDHHAVSPAMVLAGVQSGAEDVVFEDAAFFFFLVQGGDLILFEDPPELVLVAQFDFVNPFDDVGVGLGSRRRLRFYEVAESSRGSRQKRYEKQISCLGQISDLSP
jgi:hypothetical protein